MRYEVRPVHVCFFRHVVSFLVVIGKDCFESDTDELTCRYEHLRRFICYVVTTFIA